MANDLLSLASSLERKAKAIEESASETAVETALVIVDDLAHETPVDTSQALSNWIVTLNVASTAKILPHFPGKSGSSKRASAAETVNLARSVLNNKKPGQAIFITNNLSYVRRLNDGYSGQAPAGFVERVVVIGRKMITKFKIKS